jgi:hypothetical protein
LKPKKTKNNFIYSNKIKMSSNHQTPIPIKPVTFKKFVPLVVSSANSDLKIPAKLYDVSRAHSNSSKIDIYGHKKKLVFIFRIKNFKHSFKRSYISNFFFNSKFKSEIRIIHFTCLNIQDLITSKRKTRHCMRSNLANLFSISMKKIDLNYCL